MRHVQEPDDAQWSEYANGAKGGVYEYKEPMKPGSGPGKHVGPASAQEMEKTAIGKTIVETGDDGFKKLDLAKLTKANAAQGSWITRKLADLTSRVDKMGGARG